MLDYDPRAFAPVAVTVDVVALTIRDGAAVRAARRARRAAVRRVGGRCRAASCGDETLDDAAALPRARRGDRAAARRGRPRPGAPGAAAAPTATRAATRGCGSSRWPTWPSRRACPTRGPAATRPAAFWVPGGRGRRARLRPRADPRRRRSTGPASKLEYTPLATAFVGGRVHHRRAARGLRGGLGRGPARRQLPPQGAVGAGLRGEHRRDRRRAAASAAGRGRGSTGPATRGCCTRRCCGRPARTASDDARRRSPTRCCGSHQARADARRCCSAADATAGRVTTVHPDAVHPDRAGPRRRPSPGCRAPVAERDGRADDRTQRGTYRVGRWRRRGDIAESVRRRATALLKLPRRPGDNDLMRREARALTPAARRTATRGIGPYAPRLIESFTHADAARAPPARVNVARPAGRLRPPRRGARGVPGRRRPARRGLDVAAAAGRAGCAHRAGVVHGAVLPEHVLIHPGRARPGPGRLVLLGDRARPTRVPALVRRVPRPVPAGGRRRASGRPGHRHLSWPPVHDAGLMGDGRRRPPAALRRAAASTPQPRMRPQDAWRLLAELDELLDTCTARARFRPFTISTRP